MFYPFQFKPIFKPYIWGGRNIGRLFCKPIPPEGPVAESWEIVDRPEENSIVANGPLKGKTLRWLMETHGKGLMGTAPSWNGRFPLLVKILDAQEKLSVQVHPPAAIAKTFGGEPKTEMWYVVEARPGACLYVGLKRGVTRQQFETAILDQLVEKCLHRIDIKTGDVMYLPSGRLHAIGGHCVLFEIQQNSDTTYRVYDWGRKGTDGKSRPLHIDQAMQCIDFNDFEPSLVVSNGPRVVECPWFTIEQHGIDAPRADRCDGSSFHILCGLRGRAKVVADEGTATMEPGDFLLLPATMGAYAIEPDGKTQFLKVFVAS